MDRPGRMIGAWAVEAGDVYLYLRDEYPDVRRLLEREIAALGELDLALPTIHLRRGAGAYICGEESAMLESLEGKRGLPRHKPPFPSQVGLFARPTLINNVETLYWVRDLVEREPDWFEAQGKEGHVGLRTFSVSGRVRLPGVKITPAGISLTELIETQIRTARSIRIGHFKRCRGHRILSNAVKRSTFRTPGLSMITGPSTSASAQKSGNISRRMPVPRSSRLTTQ